jgi:hypothetical protein
MRREGHDRLTKRHVRMYLVHVCLCWIHRARYYRAYGVRGVVSFLLSSLYLACRETRYVDGGVRLLLRFLKVKWQVRPGYHDPVSQGGQRHTITVTNCDRSS